MQVLLYEISERFGRRAPHPKLQREDKRLEHGVFVFAGSAEDVRKCGMAKVLAAEEARTAFAAKKRSCDHDRATTRLTEDARRKCHVTGRAARWEEYGPQEAGN